MKRKCAECEWNASVATLRAFVELLPYSEANDLLHLFDAGLSATDLSRSALLQAFDGIDIHSVSCSYTNAQSQTLKRVYKRYKLPLPKVKCSYINLHMHARKTGHDVTFTANAIPPLYTFVYDDVGGKS